MSATPKRKHTGNGGPDAERRRWARLMLRTVTPAPARVLARLAPVADWLPDTEAVALAAAAEDLAAAPAADRLAAAWYECESLAPSTAATAGRVYRIDIDLQSGHLTCDCPQARHRGATYCKHIMMALAGGCGPYHVRLTDAADPHGVAADPLPPGLALLTPVPAHVADKARHDLALYLEELAERQERKGKRATAPAATAPAATAAPLTDDDLYGGTEHLATQQADRQATRERRELSTGARAALPGGFEPGRTYTRAEWLDLVRQQNAAPAGTGQSAVAR